MVALSRPADLVVAKLAVVVVVLEAAVVADLKLGGSGRRAQGRGAQLAAVVAVLVVVAAQACSWWSRT